LADLHIEDFHQDVARILVALYNRFPQPAALFVSDLIGEHEPDAFGVPAPRQLACFGAMVWLADEGFLRYSDTIRQEAIDQACLSERAFVLLSKTDPEQRDPSLPASIARQRATLAQRLRDALSSGSSSHLYDTVQYCFLPRDK